MEYITFHVIPKIEFTKTNAGTRKLPMTLNTYTHLSLEDATDELKLMKGYVLCFGRAIFSFVFPIPQWADLC